MTTPIPSEPHQAAALQHADQRAHDVFWLTAAERAAMDSPAEGRGIATVPDLSKLPAEPKVPDRGSVNDYSLQSMGDYLDALKVRDAYHHASRAAELQTSGGSHQDIMRALAAAEMAAPENDRSFHAGRLDQYASAHGLKGWYRHRTSRGEHLVQVNKIRTRDEGDKGRYYAYDPFATGTPRVVDRDTGMFVTPGMNPKAARDWISSAESARLAEPAGQDAGTQLGNPSAISRDRSAEADVGQPGGGLAMAEQPAPWLEEILRAAGDISPSTASKVQQAAEYWYQRQYGRYGEAWAQYAARQAAKGVLAVVATENDPAVRAAFRRQEGRLHVGADPGARANLELEQTWAAARKRYDAQVRDAWRKADTDFVASHRGELDAVDPEGFKHMLEGVKEDSPSAAPALPSPSAEPRETGSSASGPEDAKRAGSPQAGRSIDYPDAVAPGGRARPAAHLPAASQSSQQPARRTL